MTVLDTDQTTHDGAGDTSQEACPACAHVLSSHDRIGARFCKATTAGGLTRGCACGAAGVTAGG
jgi:hypothetical protein